MKLHDDLDLNSHHIQGVLRLELDEITLNYDLDLNGHRLISEGATLVVFNHAKKRVFFTPPVKLFGMSVWVEGQLAVQQVTQTLGLNSI